MIGRVEQTAVRLVLVVWIALAIVGAVAGRGDGTVTVRVALVAVAGILIVEGARSLAARYGPAPSPIAPLVRRVRRSDARRPSRLQSWVDLFRAAEGDPHVGPLLGDRLRDLAAARLAGRGGHGVAVPVDGDRLSATVSALEET